MRPGSLAICAPIIGMRIRKYKVEKTGFNTISKSYSSLVLVTQATVDITALSSSVQAGVMVIS